MGTFLVQLHEGEVTAVCSGGKADLVRQLGAAHVVDYTKDDLGTGRYDVVYDTYGNRDLTVLRRRLTPNAGSWSSSAAGRRAGSSASAARSARWRSTRSSATRSRPCSSSRPPSDFEDLRERLADGTLVPVLDRTFALSEAKQAIDHVMAGRAKGKSVITL